jgi:uncharacterized coiled-coil protein SlyX/energy-coupling factor transporter ATP-binding protein EcfA2
MNGRMKSQTTPAIRFPIFRRLDVADYGLYVGRPQAPGLHLEFRRGLTLVVGTNGLGKTTLVTMLYRMLTGGYELGQSTLDATELGGASLDIYRMKPKQRALFADRVNDRAKDARATLEVGIGETRLRIIRRLDNLGLVSLCIDGEETELDEAGFQGEIVRLSGLSSFGDWVIFLRQMVFYFEDRRSLVWDASAQRQMFRMLFLPPTESLVFYKQEREVLELDSQVRNDHAALTRLQRRIEADEVSQGAEEGVRARIRSIAPLLEQDVRKKEELLADVDTLDERRRELRRDLLVAEDLASRIEEELEESRLRIVYSHFPEKAETAKYLISLLMSDGRCAVCSTESPGLAKTLNERVNEFCCVLCGSHVQPESTKNISSIDQSRLAALRSQLASQASRIEALQSELKDASKKYDNFNAHLISLTDEIDARRQLLDTLTASLPADSENQVRAKDELSELSKKIADDRRKLNKLANAFVKNTEALNLRVSKRGNEIKSAFARYAQGFLFESVNLKWSPHLRRLGQLQKIESFSFELDMSGTDFEQQQRRDGPAAVSESQREFIDLAFRMALIEVAGGGAGGSLVIDAPESSLDAVFVERAAQVLCRFGAPRSSNRLIIASNLVDGRLLPDLIRRGIPTRERGARLLNLMEVAVPTAAVRFEIKKYTNEWKSILRQSERA